MKTLIAILTILSFLQTTIIPLDLVLIILICRAYLKNEESNLYLAFGFGLLISFLQLTPLGLLSIIYLTIIQFTQLSTRFPLIRRSFLIVPLSLALLSLNQFANYIFFHQSLQLFPRVAIEAFLAWPILFLIKLWEERFVVRKEVKLKI